MKSQVYYRFIGSDEWQLGRIITINPDWYCQVRNKFYAGEKEYRHEPYTDEQTNLKGEINEATKERQD